MKTTKRFIIGIELKREFMPKKFLKDNEPCQWMFDGVARVTFNEEYTNCKLMFVRDDAAFDLTSGSHPNAILNYSNDAFTFNQTEAARFDSPEDAKAWYKNNWEHIWTKYNVVNRKYFTLHTLQIDEIDYYDNDGDEGWLELSKVENFIG